MKKVFIAILLLCVTLAVGRTIVTTQFNSGELSPQIMARSELSQYYAGEQKLENFIPHPQGGVQKRPGTYEISEANAVSRLIPFQYSVQQSYIIEAGHNYFRFYKEN